VAAGDVDGDGRPDLYFTSNEGSNRLYRNKGNYQFEDVTDRAGVADPGGWNTGVTMADVNGDGTFTDRTKEYGLEHVGYSRARRGT
jgi:hypothetical protein